MTLTPFSDYSELFRNCVLWWQGYDQTITGFPILPTGVTVTPYNTFTNDLNLGNNKSVKTFTNGSNNYISLSDNDAWYFGTGNWTISTWINYSDISSHRGLFGQYVDVNNQLYFYRNTDGKYYCQFKTGGTAILEFNMTYTPSLSTWYLFTIVRNGATMYVYINGTTQSLTHTVTFNAASDLTNLSLIL